MTYLVAPRPPCWCLPLALEGVARSELGRDET